MQEKLRKQLKFKSLVSSKVYYGQDCDKEMQDNVQVQLRLLEHEYNRKRNFNSNLAHKNSQLQAGIDEHRLQKMKAREAGQLLETKFAKLQESMRERIGTANSNKATNQKTEDALDQLTVRAEKQINDQSEEILRLRATIDAHRTRAQTIEHAAQSKAKTQEELLQVCTHPQVCLCVVVGRLMSERSGPTDRTTEPSMSRCTIERIEGAASRNNKSNNDNADAHSQSTHTLYCVP
jgi:hypothetical protein